MECKICSKSGKLLQCGGCKTVSYCSKECQKTDWKAHKSICKSNDKPKTLNAFKIVSQKAKRSIYINKTPIEHKKGCTETAAILFHGLLGDPRDPSKSELFRIYILVPKTDLAILKDKTPSSMVARQRLVSAYTLTAAPTIVSRSTRPCLGCGRPGTKYKHDASLGYKDVSNNGMAMLPYVYDIAVPDCGRIACGRKAVELAGACRANDDIFEEVWDNYENGCRDYFLDLADADIKKNSGWKYVVGINIAKEAESLGLKRIEEDELWRD
ncbi:hypothetical protein BJ508DRAFT_381582 [Ascobolus immersus RN42]|uniref:MYND-type domain-containing protein n=1 Tax=Ascobolus immersus RN42 TaxID=1160509 RepID=A0A3N4HDR2_ASCIM|nr:hypothetical protein BJ508DRAFT_381582 [Ascobolus immersus RN42]